MRHVARKRFGQNFLTDEGVARAIVNAIAPRPEDRMVEIGPGLGALTALLLEALGDTVLDVVELDRDLASRLRNHPGRDRLRVHQADALEFEFAGLVQSDERLRIVGNLPYNISSPLLFHLKQCARSVKDQHFMLQNEVVERMVAAPGSSVYGRLSVMLQIEYAMESIFKVPPEAFDPAPKVESALVRMIPRADLGHAPKDEAIFSDLVRQAFSQRRKM
ncbi:MAG: 16S rRNA (adenine(1518)-N(6)/adenine(1519)-N(6))-dimethyltransferase RsmA, partial [Burkholderiaceae bacterium]